MDRRQFLKSGSITGAIGLSGCVGLFDDTDDKETSNPTPTAEPTPATTQEPTPATTQEPTPEDAAVEVATKPAENIDNDTATLVGELLQFAGAEAASIGFEYRDPIASEGWSSHGIQQTEETRIFNSEMTGLRGGTEFEFRARAEVGTASDRGKIESFETTGRREIHFNSEDAEDFAAALNELAAYPGSKLTIEPGTYHFEPTETPVSGDAPAHFEVAEFENATIDGNGATIVFNDPTLGGIYFYNGKHLTLRDITFDYDPVPHTQGEIIDLSDDRYTLVLEIDEGFPLLDHWRFNVEDIWTSVHTPEGEFIQGIRSRGTHDKFYSAKEHLGGRRYRLELNREHPGNHPRGLAVGKKLVVIHGGGDLRHFMLISEVEQPTLEDLTIHASGAFAVHLVQCTEPTVRNTTIAPPPDSNRIVGSDADGVNVLNCRTGPRIENCQFKRLQDDGIVIGSHTVPVKEVINSRRVRVGGVFGPHFRESDQLEVMSPTGVRKGELPPISDVTPEYHSPRRPDAPEIIDFEKSIKDSVEVDDYLSNRAARNENFVVRRNQIKNLRARLMQINSGPGVVEKNEIEGSQGPAIMLRTDTRGVFAPKRWAEEVVVRDNVIRRPGMNYFASSEPPGIAVWHDVRDNLSVEGQPNQDITIVNNDIETCGYRGIVLRDLEGAHVEGNEIRDPYQLDYNEPGIGLSLRNVVDVTVTDNAAIGDSDDLSFFGAKAKTEAVTDSENILVVDGDESPGMIVPFDEIG